MVTSTMSHVCKDRDCAWGQSVVITGASSGIGRSLAYEFSRRHASIALLARSEHSLNDILRECEDYGARVLTFRVDVSDESAMKEITHKVIQAFGGIDIWINNAAVSLFGRIEEVPFPALRKVIETNLFGYINGYRAILPFFREEGRGTIVNISSLAGKIAQPYTGAYSASKAAVNAIAESARMELADMPGIRVSTVIVGSVDTPLFQHAGNYSGRAIKPILPVKPVDQVAKRIADIALKPSREVFIGAFPRMLALYMRALFPGLTEKLASRIVETRHFQDRPAEPSAGNVFEPKEDQNSASGGWYHPLKRSKRKMSPAIGLAAAFGAAIASWVFFRNRAGTRSKRNVPLSAEHAFYSMNVAE